MAKDNPSVPLLVYLHADRFVARSSRLIDGTPVPCSDQAVHTQPLATLLFASAFWSLRELGLLDMEVVERKNVLGMFPHAEIKVAPRGRDERPGLEGSILDNLEGEEALRDVVCRWSGSHSTDPWHDTVHEAVSEAVTGGYLTEVREDCGALARFLWGGSHLEPDCRRIGGLNQTVGRFADSWRRFQQDTFCDRLTEQCKKSLLACTERWYA